MTTAISDLLVISVEYDDAHPETYDGGVYVGIVVKRDADRIKILFPYETGGQEIAWLTRFHK